MSTTQIDIRYTGGHKPGFLFRLGTLIVLQVLFIFAALAVIIFVPSGYDTPLSYQDRRQQIESLLRNLEPILNPTTTSVTGEMQSPNVAIRAAHPELIAAAVFCRQPDGSVEEIWNLEGAFSRTDNVAHGALDYADRRLVDLALCQPTEFIMTKPSTEANPVTYYRAPAIAGRNAVLVTAEASDSFVASRSSLGYTLFVLFLCSTLVSLLTVYLLSRRFKEPLDRISRGLDKTADGEVFYLMESEGDEELQRLCRSVNRMTETLWQNQGNLRQFNVRLNDMNMNLIESQLFLTTLIDSSPIAIIVTSFDGQIVLFNRAASEAFGYAYDAIVGSKIDRLLGVTGEKVQTPSEQPSAGGFETICRRNDDELFPAYVLASPIMGRDGHMGAMLYLLRDISESRNFQNMMVRLDRFATRGQMAGDIAHEINNYLAILLGNLELLPLIIKKGDMEKADKKIEIMKGTVDKIGRFAAGLLDIPQDEARFEPASLNQLVENVLAFVKPQNKFDMIEWETALAPDLPSAQVDAGQVQQLLVNLVYNAAAAMETIDGPRRIRIHTRTSTLDGARSVRVEVKDSGPGVPVEREASLFVSRFTTKKKGHGIGLITCRKIVDAHQGKIEYRTDSGAVFAFELPIVSTAAREGEAPLAEVPAAAEPHRPVSV